MKSVCICGEVHLPYQIRWYWPSGEYTEPAIETYFDQESVFSSFERMGKEVIRINRVLASSIKKGGRYTFNISGMFLEHCKWNPDVILSFRKLANTGNIEFAASPYYHSVSSLYSELSEFKEQVMKHRNVISDLFGSVPSTFVNSELLLSSRVGEMLREMGFQCLISEGSHNVLNGYDAVHVYDDHVPTLLRHIDLSEDIEKRFSEKKWSGYPLIADKFASWVSSMKGDVVTLYFNYDALARHHRNEAKICRFIRELPKSLHKNGIEMLTPMEAVHRYKKVNLPTLRTESTARYGMHSLLGNHVQNMYLHELMTIGQELKDIRETEQYDNLKLLYGYLQQSDILLDMNSNNFQLAYERAVNNFSILSDFRRTVLEART